MAELDTKTPRPQAVEEAEEAGESNEYGLDSEAVGKVVDWLDEGELDG